MGVGHYTKSILKITDLIINSSNLNKSDSEIPVFIILKL